jgi:DNA-binding transcriptional ArsR family regulator
MSQELNKKELKENIWKEKILNFLQENPSGFTIKDIAEGIESTRITVSKYLNLLEYENKVVSQEIGVYKLYFSAERKFILLSVMRKIYNSILTGIKGKFNKEEYKEIGHIVAESVYDYQVEQFPKSLKIQMTSYRKFLSSFAKFYPYVDLFYLKKLKVEGDVNEEEEKAVYHFKNVELLEISEDFEQHFYILAGVLERTLSKVFPRRPTICTVISVNTKDKSVKLSVERQH